MAELAGTEDRKTFPRLRLRQHFDMEITPVNGFIQDPDLKNFLKCPKTIKIYQKMSSKVHYFYKVVIGSHPDCIVQQLVVILTTSNNLIGSQYDYQLCYYL